jgi:hypothetical protein
LYIIYFINIILTYYIIQVGKPSFDLGYNNVVPRRALFGH